MDAADPGSVAPGLAWDVVAAPEEVPRIRREVRRSLRAESVDDEVVGDVETVLSELLANVVLHAPGRVQVEVRTSGGEVELEVTDTAAALPTVRSVPGASGTTGRGLHLISELTSAWGIRARSDDRPGKVVWSRFGEPTAAAGPELDADLPAAGPRADELWQISLGSVPTGLVAATKEHLDGLVRELALAGDSTGRSLPTEVVEEITRAVTRFASVRDQLLRQVVDAQRQGLPRIDLHFSVGPDAADAGEAYLRALSSADQHAQDRRLLSLAAPAPYRVFREWYVRSLVRAVQERMSGTSPSTPTTFEDSLIAEVQRQGVALQESQLPALLQRVTARLSAADDLSQIGRIALEEACHHLGAAGGALSLPGRSAPVVVQVESVRLGDLPTVEALVLRAAGEEVGLLQVGWAAVRVLSDSERGYLDGLAAQTAQAVARTTALQQLSAAEARGRILAQLGERLAADLPAAALVASVVDVIVPALGELAVVHLLDEQARPHFAAARHRDAAKTPPLTELFARFPVSTDQPVGAGRVLGTGVTEVLPTIDEPLLRSVAGEDDAFVQALLDLRIGAGVIVPLVARGRTVGALSVATSADGTVSPADVEVLEDIGRRAGLAIENSRALSTSVRLELALQAAQVGSFEMILPSRRLLWDEQLFHLLDVDPTTFDGEIGTFFSRLVPEDLERTGAAIEHSIATVGELAVEYRVLLADGTVRWLEGRGRVLPDADGNAERLVGVAVDVTDKRDRSTQARRSLELMADGFVQFDADHHVLFANGQAERLLGLASLEGTRLWDSLPDAAIESDRHRVHDELAALQPSRFEAWLGPRHARLELRTYPSGGGMSLYVRDLTSQRATEDQRDRALARLRLLNAVGADLTAAQDVADALTRLSEHMVPVLGDLVSIDLHARDVPGVPGGVLAASHPELVQAMRDAETRRPRRNNPNSAVYHVLRGEQVPRLPLPADYLERLADGDADVLAAYRRIDPREALVVPLSGRDEVFGALSMIRVGDAAVPFTDEDEQLALEIGRRAGLIVENAVRLDDQRRVAEELQRSLLPRLPSTMPGMRLGSFYEPSSNAAKVGGDWYDAFSLADSSVGVVIGDVMGHDIAAAAAMGQLRSVLRTCAADGDEPGQVIDRLDHLVTTFAMADLATLVYARVRPYLSGGAELSWCNAGHPPPLLLVPGRPPEYLLEGRSTMVGVEVTFPRVPAVRELPAGSTLLMFTDGLVERRHRDLDEGLQLLADTAQRLLPDAASPADLCRALVTAVRDEGSGDDVALLALTLDR